MSNSLIAGFIGSHLAEVHIARVDEVTVVDDELTGSRANGDGCIAGFDTPKELLPTECSSGNCTTVWTRSIIWPPPSDSSPRWVRLQLAFQGNRQVLTIADQIGVIQRPWLVDQRPSQRTSSTGKISGYSRPITGLGSEQRQQLTHFQAAALGSAN